MKRIVIFAALMLAMGAGGLKAQDCRALVLPFFNGDEESMNRYPAEKLEWRCQYARNAFYVSDTVPQGAEVKSIAVVRNRQTGEYMAKDIRIDLGTLSYYAYTFSDLQQQYSKGNVTICFSTPGSDHPYLVMRSIDETYLRTEYPEQYENK